jgi:AraC-like DNA-binding protein
MWFEEYSAAHESVNLPLIVLNKVWHVKADPAYIVNRNVSETSIVLLRTLSGQGRLDTVDSTFELKTNNLLFVRMQDIRHYRCVTKDWHFYWFEFESSNTNLPFDYVFNAKPMAFENQLIEDVFATLRRENSLDRASASATFQFLIYNWQRAAVIERETNTAQDLVISKVIDRMHRKLKDNWSVGAMARYAGMGERNFRAVFSKVTGNSPKQYYDTLRLEYARAMLSEGVCLVQETAAMLNYGSQFYFSRAFSKQFGVTPSSMIPRIKYINHERRKKTRK